MPMAWRAANLNSKLHAVCDRKGRPLIMLLSQGQMSDYKDAALMIDAFPRAQALLADRGYDADWFRHALAERGIAACIPSKTNHKVPNPHDTAFYRQRHRVENMFGKLKDWRRIHTRYDRCAHSFMSAICIEATVTYWLPQGVLSLRRSAGVATQQPRLFPSKKESRSCARPVIFTPIFAGRGFWQRVNMWPARFAGAAFSQAIGTVARWSGNT